MRGTASLAIAALWLDVGLAKPDGTAAAINDRWQTLGGLQHDKLNNAQTPVVETVESSLQLSIGPIEDAIKVMQDDYFQIWVGSWPSAIDWTAAVINTFVTSTIMTMANYLQITPEGQDPNTRAAVQIEDQINQYFAQNTAFYFGENAFAIRNQAYDDMLWVVLGWLESVKFINRYADMRDVRIETEGSWYGSQYIAAFSHRARIFYDLASRGWGTKLCGGGMTWNPTLAPYKNAITNQLYISASVGMYLYFAGDDNKSPYLAQVPPASKPGCVYAHDPKYLKAAVDGYDWLKQSNMTNELGLYVDGFHITGWSRRNATGATKCDERNEMVYTYNQAVVLSGLRGLWEATGNISYLDDGHELIHNAISATGWNGSAGSTVAADDGRWKGLGRSGILEEFCDSTGQCSQDGQTFKGIFFEHLVQFCEKLPHDPQLPGITFSAKEELRSRHSQSCRKYGRWAKHNAEAAQRSRNDKGKFGSFWGNQSMVSDSVDDVPMGAVDYRNRRDDLESIVWTGLVDDIQRLVSTRYESDEIGALRTRDVNDRGRGRTVETQGSGLSVVRAAWELLYNT